MFSWIFSIIFFSILHAPEADFKQQLENYLRKNLSSFDSFEYEIISRQWDQKKNKAEIIEDTPLLIKGDLAYVQIKLVHNNEELRTILNLRLKLYKNLLLSTKLIKKDEPLSQEDFHLTKINVAELNGTPFTSFDELNQYEVKISINPGTVLINEITKKKPLVFAGDKIAAILERGNVSVSTEAFSKQEGAKGDVIKIEIPVNGSRKLFKAKVEDLNKVIIIE